MTRLHATAIAIAAVALNAWAEHADRDKPINIEANRITVDDAKKVNVFEGNVVLTQGTMVIRAGKIVVTQDESGFQKGVATGGPASFRQKRDRQDGLMEAEAERIEYDARTERAEFFNHAWVRSGQDEVRGNYISYDALSEKYTVGSPGDAKTGTPAGRVRAVIQPKTKNGETPKKGDPLPLTPAASIQSNEEKSQ